MNPDQQNDVSEEAGVNQCLNCENRAKPGDVYCSHCAQKLSDSRITAKKLIRDFAVDFFNWDSRLFLTLYFMVFPAKLSIEYIAGKRRKYLNPARLFFFSMILYFALVALILGKEEVNVSFDVMDFHKDVAKSELLNEFDSLSQIYTIEDPMLDSLKTRLFENTKGADIDSFNVMSARNVLFIHFENLKILKQDLIDMPIKQIHEKYEVKGYWNRLLSRQIIRVTRDPMGTARFVIGNTLWGVFVLIFVMALIMKLLYIRHSYFYVEHLIFQFHFSSFAFFFHSIFLLMILISSSQLPDYIFGIFFIITVIYYFIALKKYYRQGFIKTFLKFLILNFSYIIVSILFAIAVILLSVITF